MIYPVSLVVIAALTTLPARWIWGWPEERWTALHERETAPARRRRTFPFSALTSIPAWAAAAWVAAGFTFGLAVTVPGDFPTGSWADALYIAALGAPLVLPFLVYVSQRPLILVPPAARPISLKDPEPRIVKSMWSAPAWIDNSILVLAGFTSADSYRDRKAAWEPETSFRSLGEAEIEARRWLAEQGAEAQVEVIRLLEPHGKVIEVVTQAGIESIES